MNNKVIFILITLLFQATLQNHSIFHHLDIDHVRPQRSCADEVLSGGWGGVGWGGGCSLSLLRGKVDKLVPLGLGLMKQRLTTMLLNKFTSRR